MGFCWLREIVKCWLWEPRESELRGPGSLLAAWVTSLCPLGLVRLAIQRASTMRVIQWLAALARFLAVILLSRRWQWLGTVCDSVSSATVSFDVGAALVRARLVLCS